MTYDLIIIGGGPAGSAAAIYASRKRLQTLFITAEWGGQSVVSEKIHNWIGTTSLSGNELAENFKKHVLANAGKGQTLEVKEGEKASNIIKNGDLFEVTTESGEKFISKTILIASGSGRRKLEAKNADKLEHKGLTYCASCDGPLFDGADVAVIGGGNAAFETVAQLAAYCKSVTLINRSENFRADPITIDKVSQNPKVKILKNTIIAKVKGDKFLKSIVLSNILNKEESELPIAGVFVEIGSIPNTNFSKGVVEHDEYNRIVVDPKTQMAHLLPPLETASDARRGESGGRAVVNATVSATQRLHNIADWAVSGGVWAAGDCTDGLYHQNNIAAGDAIRALEDIYLHLHTK